MKNNETKKWLSVFHSEFSDDLAYWVKVDRKIALRVFDIIESIIRNPFKGIGKPEPLRFLGAGVWSRRLTQEHRVVYKVSKNRIDFILCRYHY
ncbi:MAG: Txe/YoeB family addiction module toxin [Ignavibacteria bacterium]|nr:Txe/YoeB family addiction module toxin [Ignavibacteria bacterium]